MTKKGVLLMAYGGPDSIEDVKDFYIDVRSGRIPSEQLIEELTERYKSIGGKSPLLEITQKKAAALQNLLENKYKVYVGMRHWHPFIHETVKKMIADGITEAVGIIMAPHFSKMSVEKYYQKLNEALDENGNSIKFKEIHSWHDHPKFIKAVAEKIRGTLKHFENEKPVIVFTAHSLPEKILEWNDPYPEQLNETCELIAKELKFKNWTFAYQSAGRTKDPWLGPDLLNKLETLKSEGVNSVLVCPVGFISDHLEVIFDIDIEAQEKAKELGIHLERAPSLNDTPLLIECFSDLVTN